MADLRVIPLLVESDARRRAIELAAPAVAVLPRLSTRNVGRVLLRRHEPLQVARIAPLPCFVLSLELRIELGERAAKVATARLARDEEVLEVFEQTPVVRRCHETSGPFPEPVAEP